MTVDADYLYTALLSYNYFPMVKEHRDETPSLFSTEAFGPTTADLLVGLFNSLPKRHKRRKDGFDQIEYRTTRFTNVARQMAIPTPMGYARLCRELFDCWSQDTLSRICDNPSSRIRPEMHEDGRAFRSDEYENRYLGRVVIMGKDDAVSESAALIEASMGMFYFVEADVSSCFPSIYTHALPWALVGVEIAKKSRGDNDIWFNKIDRYQRLLKRNETLGVPVGPATSNLACEVVLYKVDEAMRSKGYEFSRYIDDYRAYCKTREQAEAFLRDLERELGVYLLSINAKKVKIEPLPRPLVAPWVLELRARLPRAKRATASAVCDYLNFAVSLDRLEPDGSVVKYATRAISKKLGRTSGPVYCQFVLNLALHVPVVLPALAEAVKGRNVNYDEHALESLLKRHIEYRRSDAVGWTAYLYHLTRRCIPVCAARAIVESGDCMSMASLLAVGGHQRLVREFVESLARDDTYCLDRYWLLIHELHLLDLLPADGRLERYVEESGLTILREAGVSFLTTSVRNEPADAEELDLLVDA